MPLILSKISINFELKPVPSGTGFLVGASTLMVVCVAKGRVQYLKRKELGRRGL
jgi:hypothetical protein